MPKIRFIEPSRTVEVVAQPGQTLLEVAEEHHVKMGSACGGVCACSACHCWIRAGSASLDEASDKEADRLDMAFDVRPYSRLGCQSVVEGDVTVEIPDA